MYVIIISCAIVTREANFIVEPVHERMPCILKNKDFEEWLNPSNYDTFGLRSLVDTIKEIDLNYYPVSTQMNKVGFNSFDCIEPLEEK